MKIEALFHDATSTLTYLISDPETRDAVVVDPVLDFDPGTVATAEDALEALLARIREQDLRVHLVLETHAHADHLTGAQRLRAELGARIGIGAGISAVQDTFGPIFGWGDDVPLDGSQWDVLMREGEPVQAGSLTIETLTTPGHTPACVTYRIGDAIFTGDTLFMPDFGTGRCDFPGGSAEQLYDSIMKLYALPDDTRVFVGHDYKPGGRELRWETTIGACKEQSKQLRADTERDAFTSWRTARDATLPPPRLLFQSLQVNANAGKLPEPDANGVRYLKMPMDVL